MGTANILQTSMVFFAQIGQRLTVKIPFKLF